ncbi:hypothetical protein [Spartinivicinus poritis]|uniref:Uncharacterized protein n=1 Tax=Spartinivicinus poritis TaxID=2994640 RepID=A0ABT5U3L5_9GAMM|nr:hypothetical protein [Spartinivicinus sp. A2-2]MDE1460954.1 hypothetical protein [Spartinivicinus sp. A2-2]
MLTSQFELTKESKKNLIEEFKIELAKLAGYKNKGLSPKENKKNNLIKNAYQAAIMLANDIPGSS